jgi:hypothetical protein
VPTHLWGTTATENFLILVLAQSRWQFKIMSKGAYTPLGNDGYRELLDSGIGAKSLAVYIRRAIAFGGGTVIDDDALLKFASVELTRRRCYDDIVSELRSNSFSWIAWPGSTVPPGSVEAVSNHTSLDRDPKSEQFKSDEYEGSDGKPSVSKEVYGSSAVAEVEMNDVDLCAEPFDDFGALVVTAEVWSPSHLFGNRVYSLILRNPTFVGGGRGDHSISRGISLLQGDRQILYAHAEDIMSAFGENANTFLLTTSFYDSVRMNGNLIPVLLQNPLELLSAVPPAPAMPIPSAPPAENVVDLVDNSIRPADPAVTETLIDDSIREDGSASVTVESENEASECPICMEDIQPNDAAMRCVGVNGIHHYFHAGCLRRWISSAEERGQVSNCPICRGRLQFHGRRLQDFLLNPNSAELSVDQRNFFQTISDGLSGRDSWENMNIVEQAAYGTGLLAAAGAGFFMSYSDRNTGVNPYIAHEAWASLPREHQFAVGIGWVGGVVARIIHSSVSSKSGDDKKEDE